MSRPRSTKKSRVEAARSLLSGLLRSPKGRAGLISAVAPHGVSKHFVYGTLEQWLREGTVTILKSGETVLYQLTNAVVNEKPRASEYPSWLEPRSIPSCSHRLVVVDGKRVRAHAMKEEQEQ